MAQPTLVEKVVDQIGYSNAALEKAAAFMSGVSKRQQAVEALIPACVDQLIAHGRITESEKQACADFLKDPVQAIKLLTKVASHRTRDELAALGVPAGQATKTAGIRETSGSGTPYVGSRQGQVSEATRRFCAGLGVPIPEDE